MSAEKDTKEKNTKEKKVNEGADASVKQGLTFDGAWLSRAEG